MYSSSKLSRIDSLLESFIKSKKTNSNQHVSESISKLSKYLTAEEINLLRSVHTNKETRFELEEYLNINIDFNPERIFLKSEKQVKYVQKLSVRYLQPPKPPTPEPIIITVRKSKFMKPPPPIILRQIPPRPLTPEPIILREKPPEIPEPRGVKVIRISGKRCPPPPRKVIIEKLPPLPCRPAPVILERWLAYNQPKRKVFLHRPESENPIYQKSKNVIVQWEQPKVKIKQKIVNLGTIIADPVKYAAKYNIPMRHNVPFT